MQCLSPWGRPVCGSRWPFCMEIQVKAQVVRRIVLALCFCGGVCCSALSWPSPNFLNRPSFNRHVPKGPSFLFANIAFTWIVRPGSCDRPVPADDPCGWLPHRSASGIARFLVCLAVLDAAFQCGGHPHYQPAGSWLGARSNNFQGPYLELYLS